MRKGKRPGGGPSVAGREKPAGKGLGDGKLRERRRDVVQERRLLHSGERLAMRQRERLGILLLVVHAELVMQMWTGCPARLADVTDDVALRHAHAGPQIRREGGEMGVQRA